MIIDLSTAINPQTVVYPGDKPAQLEALNHVDNDGFSSHQLTLGTHVGTHIDAPAHVSNGAQALDQIDPEQFIGRGVLIEVIDGDFSQVMQASIQPGEIVLFYTGMSEKLGSDDYFRNIPVMSEDVANYLVQSKIKMIGLDVFSVDSSPTLPIHHILLGNNILIIENLVNLDQVKGKQFQVIALPLKLQAEAAPARVVAKIN